MSLFAFSSLVYFVFQSVILLCSISFPLFLPALCFFLTVVQVKVEHSGAGDSPEDSPPEEVFGFVCDYAKSVRQTDIQIETDRQRNKQIETDRRTTGREGNAALTKLTVCNTGQVASALSDSSLLLFLESLLCID